MRGPICIAHGILLQFPEDYMALYSEGSRRVRIVILVAFSAMLLMSAVAMAQDQPVPKVDVFTGYQWLSPGATIPAPHSNPLRPLALKLPDIPQGAGAALTYNFDPHFGLEVDYGSNFNKFGVESTISAGPRLMFRSEGANFFVHTLLGYNRFSREGLNASNGVGAVLGGARPPGAGLALHWRACSVRTNSRSARQSRAALSRVESPWRRTSSTATSQTTSSRGELGPGRAGRQRTARLEASP